MAEVLPLSKTELRLLETLLRHKIRFMVVGLSAAALQGAPVVTEDIDLWFDNLSDPKLMQALVKVDELTGSKWLGIGSGQIRT